MREQPAALSGSFADFKLVKSRSVAQLVIEIAIEQADDALRILGGLPQPGKENPVALARLKVAPEPERVPAPPPDPERQRSPVKSEKARQAYLDKDEWGRAAQRAAMLCKDRRFQDWVAGQWGRPVLTEEVAAAWLRDWLVIGSRAEIGTDERAFLAFKKLEDAYQMETKYKDQLDGR